MEQDLVSKALVREYGEKYQMAEKDRIGEMLYLCFFSTGLYVCLCYTLICNIFVYHYNPSADVWGDGDLPPGWREISDSSEVYFWHVPTGTTQYHRPVASGNQHISLNIEPDTEHNPYQEMKDSLKAPNEVRGPAARRNLGICKKHRLI